MPPRQSVVYINGSFALLFVTYCGVMVVLLFCSTKVNNFGALRGIEWCPSSPHYPQGSTVAVSAVKWAKSLLTNVCETESSRCVLTRSE